MRYDDIYVTGTGSYYPPRVTTDEAVADGRYDLATQRRTGLQSVAIADADTQPGMAVTAGRQARERSGVASEDFGLLLHCIATFNGLEGWNSASYVQQNVIDGHGFSFEVHQQSNTAVGALMLACAYLDAGAPLPAVMLTAADKFGEPAWDRWRAAPRVVYADGASAVALGRGAGFARVVSVVTVADSELEGMHRGRLPFTTNPGDGYPISIFGRIFEFADEKGYELDKLMARMGDGMRRAGTQACEEAGIAPDQAEHVVTPNLGRDMSYEQVLDPLGLDIDRTTWQFGATVGHAGCTDQFGGLNHLVEAGKLAAGDRVLMLGNGGGINWTSVVLEVVEPPGVAGPS